MYCCCHLICICCTVCVLLFFTLDAGLLARSQYPEGPATGHLDTGFSRFPCVYKQMLRWLPTFQVATTCFSWSPPGLNLLVTNFNTKVNCTLHQYTLTFQRLPVTLRTTKYNTQKFFMVITLHLCVLYGS